VPKNKEKKYYEISTFPNVLEPDYRTDIENFPLKNKWSSTFFKNNNPIVIEMGCGKGEYTVGLAKNNHNINYVGIDIKGDRIWHGAKKSLDLNLNNTGFLRIQAEKINQYFGNNEVSEIWITFPDPQPNKPKIKKRLTSPQFIDRYKKLLKPGSAVHLKTDNLMLFEYTLSVIKEHNHKLIASVKDIYKYTGNHIDPTVKEIQTYYEKLFLKENSEIYYLKFVI